MSDVSPSPDLALWYRAPASEWTQALPVGNGRLGAMVFGGLEVERLQLNEDTLWSGAPYDPVNPDAAAALGPARDLIREGRYADARALIDERVMARPLRQAVYQTAGDLRLTTPGLAGEVTRYERRLDLDAAIATTQADVDGVTHRRRVVVSPEHQVIALHVGTDGADGTGRVSFTLGYGSPLQRWEVAADGDAGLVVHGTGDPHAGTDALQGAVRFVVRVHVDAVGGTVTTRGGEVVVEGADEATVLVAVATSHRGPDDVSGDPDGDTRRHLDAARRLSFEEIAHATADEHRALFGRFSLDLGVGRTDLPTDERIRAAVDVDDPGLAALYLNYARYLLISSSRPGSQPANLQGIWNELVSPPWGSKWTVNINAEMNYWPAHATGLGECARPLEQLVREVAVTGARTARSMYGARGWVCHHNTDLWRATAPVDGATWGMWPTGGAWLCLHLFQRYAYDGDEAYLRSVFPVLRDASLFFLDTLVVDEATGALVTSPSVSPENEHPYGSSVVAGPTMDSQILRALFGRTVEAAQILHLDEEVVAEVAAARDRLLPSRVGAQGQLQEWQHDWDADAPEPHHRHTSHLFGVYPGTEIHAERTPELADGARRTLQARGDESTGWATAWRISLWARLRDGEHAHRMLTMLLSPGLTYPNMLDAHPPFQIDGNFGGAAGILEMLVQHDGEEVHLLPALPSAWPMGEVRGLRLPGGIALDLRWQDGVAQRASLTADRPVRRTVRGAGDVREVELGAGEQVVLGAAGPVAG